MPETTDNQAKNRMQLACNFFADLFPGRAFCVFVFPSNPNETAHYAGNAKRKEIMKAVTELADKGLPGLAPDERDSN